MYRPVMATWFESIVRRMPLRAIPTRKQIEIAKTFTAQPEITGISLTYTTAHALVWAQAMEAQCAADGRLAQELMAALTWDRGIVVPDPLRVMQAQREPHFPKGALSALAQMHRQTVYLLIEQPALGDADGFINGAWLMRDVNHETREEQLLLLLDLLVQGKPVRDVLMEFTLEDTLEAAVERQVEKIAAAQQWDTMPGALARRDNMRGYLLGARSVLAAFHDVFVADPAQLEIARAAARADKLGFTFLDLAPQRRTGNPLAAGLIH